MKRELTKPVYFAVYEREARMNGTDNQMIMAHYLTIEEADEARVKYFGVDNDNYYVDVFTYM